MNVIETIKARRSIRKYKDTPLTEADIKEIVEAGTMAPSGTNIQPWYFVVISEPGALAELKSIASEGAQVFKKALEERFRDHPEVVKSTTSFIGTLGNAPVAVLAFMRDQRPESKNNAAVQSIAAAIQNMLLAATEKGIGSCWLTSLSDGAAGEAIRERFAPERGDLMAVAVFGYADQEPKMPPRKDDRVEYII